MSNRSLAVVGAGAAGLGAAHALSGTDVEVTVFEATDRVGGRLVTRERDGYRYDTGANYITPDDDRMAGFLSELGPDGLVDVEEPVFTFGVNGRVTEGDPDRQDDHRWTYESGIEEFARRLADRADATIRAGTEVDRLAKLDDGWDVLGDGAERLARVDGVLLTPPAPRTARILSWTAWNDDRLRGLLEPVDSVPYRTVVTVVLNYPFELDVPYYALVNTDRRHPVGWLSREECKDGHVPDGESVLIAQMSPEWSSTHYATEAERVVDMAADRVAGLLDDDRLADPEWADRDRFPVALPDAGVPRDAIEPVESDGLFLAGDWVVGKGRVSLAFFDGVDAAERIEEWLAR